jgi:hypothetical protein
MAKNGLYDEFGLYRPAFSVADAMRMLAGKPGSLLAYRHASQDVVWPDDQQPDPPSDIDRVIDALDRRIVPDRDRTRLREATDRADAPLTGRAGADEGLRGAIGRVR